MIKAMADSFRDEVATGAVLVDFYGKTCGPCRAMEMILKNSEENFNKAGLKIIKVDVDECPAIAEEFGVSAIPSMHILVDGERVDGFVGMRTRAQIVSIVEDALR